MSANVASQPNEDLDSREAVKQRKRVRGELSCLECRRLRIRCDRKVPCTSCIRRGYSSLCPNGSPEATTIDVNKLLADLEKSQARVHQLEDALRASHANQRLPPHPLLLNVAASGPSDTEAAHDPSELFGTLTIADDGESRFLGPSATAENFLLSEIANDDHADNNTEVPLCLTKLGQTWPFSPEYQPRVDYQELIESQLPSYNRASSLCEAFLQNLAWFLQPISRAQIMEKLLPSIYKRRKADSRDGAARDFALLFAVFACGAAGDLTQEPSNEEGQKYKNLAKSALGLSSVLTRASLSSVQTMILLSLYSIYAARNENQEESWKTLSLAMSTATSLGLHRDPDRWELPTDVQEERRSIFWELYSLESSRAMASGRPPVIPLKAIDVKYPQSVQTGARDTFWKYEFMQKCLAPVAERFCGDATPVKYHEVLEFDASVREFENEMAQKYPRAERVPIIDPTSLFEGNITSVHCEIVRIRIHLNFFARAVMDCPDNPLRSPFAQSFQATFRGGMAFLKEFGELVEANLALMLRFWPLWSHAFISMIVIGTVAFRCPTFNLAEPAFSALNLAVSSFQKGEEHPVVVKGLPILLKIKEKAQKSLCSRRSLHHGIFMADGTHTPTGNSNQADTEDNELSMLQGATRVVTQKEVPSEPSPALASQSLYQNGLGDHQYLQYTDTPSDIYSSESGPSDIHAFSNALNNWTKDMDALMTEQLLDVRIAPPAVESATEDGTFASLGIESMLSPVANAAVGNSDSQFDAWYSGGDVMQDSAGFFGDWNF